MEPAVVIPSRRRSRDSGTDTEKCLLCQTITPESLSTLKEQGRVKLQASLKERSLLRDEKSQDIIDRIQAIDLHDLVQKQMIVYHRTCYCDVTNATNISRLRRKFEKARQSYPSSSQMSSSTDAEHPFLRHSVPALNKGLCIFCQKDTSKPTCLVMTEPVSNKILQMIQDDNIMSCRLAGISDLIAADARYHLQCYVEYCRKSKSSKDSCSSSNVDPYLSQVIQELRDGMSRGEVYTLKDVWQHYSNLLTKAGDEPGLYKNCRRIFKQKLEKCMPNEIHFIPQLDPHEPQLLFPAMCTQSAIQTLKKQTDELEDTVASEHIKMSKPLDLESETLLTVYHAACNIRAEIKSAPPYNNCASMNNDLAKSVIPETLFVFVHSLLSDGAEEGIDDVTDECDQGDSTTSVKVLSICQDIVYAVSKGKTLTPKHVGLGMAVHQATRSKALVKLLHNAGHCIPYDQVRRVDTTLAERELENYSTNGNVPVPSNLTPRQFVHFAADNIDIIEETLDGKGTFHATQMVAYQHPSETNKPEGDIKSLPIGDDKCLKVPHDFQELCDPPHSATRPNPTYAAEQVKQEWFDADTYSEVRNEADAKDLAWALCRQHNPGNQIVPAWTGFNQVIAQGNDAENITTVGFMPIINAPAHEPSTMWTVLLRCLKVSEKINPGCSTVLTVDQQLYCKAKELQWANQEFLAPVVIKLGSFHIAHNFMRVIGQHMTDSGITDVWRDSSVFGEATADNIIAAKSYNRSIRAHKLTYDALFRILWPLILQWANENDVVIADEIHAAVQTMARQFQQANQESDTSESFTQLVHAISQHHLQGILKEFDAQLPSTAKYWRQYMEMVTILLQFIRAEREGNWNLHLSALADMLPWFSAYNHNNYTRWGTVYLADMQLLPQTNPDIHKQFMDGNFVIKRSQHPFNKISTDQGLEHINRVSKVAGGLVGITKTDSARDRWCVTFNERSRISQETWDMFSIEMEDTEYNTLDHKDLSKSRIVRDESDVRKLQEKFNELHVFSCDHQAIVCLSTNDVAPADVTQSLLTADDRGRGRLSAFVKDRLSLKNIAFHDKLTNVKYLTLQNMYQLAGTTNASILKMAKADRNLFQRLLIAKDAGRDINLDSLLEYELSPVPLSLADTAGQLRHSDKAALSHILEENVLEDTIPVTLAQTCTIIDGQALVQAMGKPSGCATFGDFADSFASKVFSYLKPTSTRVDVVFDRYLHHSVKSAMRKKRTGPGTRLVRRMVNSRDVPLPTNWKQFIDLPENKTNLSEFLSSQLMIKAQSLNGYEVIVAAGFADIEDTRSSQGRDMRNLMSNHEEADTRIILHGIDAQQQGFNQLVVVCQDTDVLVLLTHFADKLCQEIWFKAGTTRQHRNIKIHSIEMPLDVRGNLVAFHAITGCDTVSSFYGIGKKKAWKVFLKHPHLLQNLGLGEITTETVAKAEEFVCRLYQPNSALTSINKVRSKMFQKGMKELENLPPTANALKQHILRAHFQAAVWRSANSPKPGIPEPTDSGWHLVQDSLVPVLTTANPIPSAYTPLLTCRCTNCATSKCTCRSKHLRCIAACQCSEQLCHNPYNPATDDE